MEMVETKKDKLYSIVLAGDYGYIRQIETTIKSLCYHHTHLKIYIFNQDIPQEWFVNLRKKLVKLECQLIDIKLFEESFNSSWISSYPHIKPIAYARYFIPYFIEEEQVLYLDSDLVVTANLNEMLQIELQDHLIAASRFVFGKGVGFNSGVMLVNNRLWKERQIAQELIRVTETEHANLYEGDQQVLNMVIGQNYLLLDDEYNFQIGFDKAAEIYGHNFIFDYSLDPLPKIVHYISPDKPWNMFSVSRLREVWWFYNGLDWGEIVECVDREKGLVLPSSSHFKLFTLTNTQDISHIEYLVKHLPTCQFSIAAYTNMAPNLLKLSRFENVTLLPNILVPILKKQIENCDLYLNINNDVDFEKDMAELLASNKQIFSFDTTSQLEDNREIRFSEERPEDMVKAIQNML